MIFLPASLASFARPAISSSAVSHVASTGAEYVDSNTTISSPNTPAGVATGDGLFAIVFARSALTPPAGWTLVDSQLAIRASVSQTIYIYRRDSAASGDSSTAFTWTQASSGRMGLAYVLARSSTGALSVAETGKRGTDIVAETGTSDTWAIPCPTLTAALPGELFLLAAEAIIIAASGDSTWTAPTGATLRTTATIGQNRLAAATQDRAAGQSNSTPFTLAFTGTGDTNTGAITVRLQPA